MRDCNINELVKNSCCVILMAALTDRHNRNKKSCLPQTGLKRKATNVAWPVDGEKKKNFFIYKLSVHLG